MATALDPCNTGTNAARGENDDVSNADFVGVRAAGAAESKGDGVSGPPQLVPRAMGSMKDKGGVEGNGMLQKCTSTDN